MSGTERELEDLEALWSGDFGDAYTSRNADVHAGRGLFWRELLGTVDVGSVLEIGCNLGGNLRHILEQDGRRRVVGIDVNRGALHDLRGRLPGCHVARASAGRLPFADGAFDLVFSAGVLIHVPDAALPDVMGEVVRCARRYVLALEYRADRTEEVPYRGQRGALFKRDYGDLYARRSPELALEASGRLTRREDWDDVTWWLFRRSERP